MRQSLLLTGILACATLIFTGQVTMAQDQGTATADSLSVKSVVLTTDVVNREPVDSVQTFAASDSEAFCHIRVRNTGEPATVTFRWLHDGSEYYTYDANVGTSAAWRTYTSVNPSPGEWTVEILGPNGSALAQRSFRVASSQENQAGR